jgi:hypothetical protein
MNKRKINNKLNDDEIKYINLLFGSLKKNLKNILYITEISNNDNIRRDSDDSKYITIKDKINVYFDNMDYNINIQYFAEEINKVFEKIESNIKIRYRDNERHNQLLFPDIELSYLKELEPLLITLTNYYYRFSQIIYMFSIKYINSLYIDNIEINSVNIKLIIEMLFYTFSAVKLLYELQYYTIYKKINYDLIKDFFYTSITSVNDLEYYIDISKKVDNDYYKYLKEITDLNHLIDMQKTINNVVDDIIRSIKINQPKNIIIEYINRLLIGNNNSSTLINEIITTTDNNIKINMKECLDYLKEYNKLDEEKSIIYTYRCQNEQDVDYIIAIIISLLNDYLTSTITLNSGIKEHLIGIVTLINEDDMITSFFDFFRRNYYSIENYNNSISVLLCIINIINDINYILYTFTDINNAIASVIIKGVELTTLINNFIKYINSKNPFIQNIYNHSKIDTIKTLNAAIIKIDDYYINTLDKINIVNMEENLEKLVKNINIVLKKADHLKKIEVENRLLIDTSSSSKRSLRRPKPMEVEDRLLIYTSSSSKRSSSSFRKSGIIEENICNTDDDINKFLLILSSNLIIYLKQVNLKLNNSIVFDEKNIRIIFKFFNNKGNYYLKNELLNYIIQIINNIYILLYKLNKLNNKIDILNGIYYITLLNKLKNYFNDNKNIIKYNNIIIYEDAAISALSNDEEYIKYIEKNLNYNYFKKDIEKTIKLEEAYIINEIKSYIFILNNLYTYDNVNNLIKIKAGGNKNNYKKTDNQITVIYKKKKYTRTIYICERKKYVKIDKTFILLSKLKKDIKNS